MHAMAENAHRDNLTDGQAVGILQPCFTTNFYVDAPSGRPIDDLEDADYVIDLKAVSAARRAAWLRRRRLIEAQRQVVISLARIRRRLTKCGKPKTRVQTTRKAARGGTARKKSAEDRPPPSIEALAQSPRGDDRVIAALFTIMVETEGRP
jgi:hypothetical protein